MAPQHASLFLFTAAVLCCVVSASGSLASNVSAPTVNPTCMRVNSVASECDVRNTCMRCINAAGCAYDTMMRECITTADAGDSLYTISANPQSSTSNITFCAEEDARCAACVVTSAQPLCQGADGCICRSTCDVMRAVEMTCYLQKQSSIVYISILVLGVALPLLLWIQRFIARRRGHGDGDAQTVAHTQRVLQLQRRQQPRVREPSALALQLESWRSHRNNHKLDVDKVELANCYTLMETNSQPTTQPERSPSASSVHSESKENGYDVAVVVDGPVESPRRQTEL